MNEITGKAAELICERGWGQGQRPVSIRLFTTGEICLGLALVTVTSGDLGSMIAAWNDVCAVIVSHYAERAQWEGPLHYMHTGSVIEGRRADVCIPCFNDHQDTTEEDIFLVLKLAGEDSGTS